MLQESKLGERNQKQDMLRLKKTKIILRPSENEMLKEVLLGKVNDSGRKQLQERKRDTEMLSHGVIEKTIFLH